MAFAVFCLVLPKIDTKDVVLYPRVIVNRTVILNCPASGIPAPSIVWTKSGEVFDPILHPNVQILADGRQLRITSAAISDSGSYTCTARNKAGDDSLELQLSVFSKNLMHFEKSQKETDASAFDDFLNTVSISRSNVIIST